VPASSTPQREAPAERLPVAFSTECPASRRATGVRKDRTKFFLYVAADIAPLRRRAVCARMRGGSIAPRSVTWSVGIGALGTPGAHSARPALAGKKDLRRGIDDMRGGGRAGFRERSGVEHTRRAAAAFERGVQPDPSSMASRPPTGWRLSRITVRAQVPDGAVSDDSAQGGDRAALKTLAVRDTR
jgi:hypothetical protein